MAVIFFQLWVLSYNLFQKLNKHCHKKKSGFCSYYSHRSSPALMGKH